MQLMYEVELLDRDGNIIKRQLLRAGPQKLWVKSFYGEVPFWLKDGTPVAGDWRSAGLRVTSDSLNVVRSRYVK